MADQRVFTLTEVAQHQSKNDCWFVINGRVLNVTKFLELHPGGEEVLIESAGKDATKEFENIGHSNAAKKLLIKYQVGVLVGYTFEESETKDDSIQKPRKKEMEAFVIKNDKMPTYTAILEFFVPLLVACSYFAYRLVTRTEQMLY
ncbi:hypothetical protein LWI28_009195 [Acer negundo]|uniref:Cytochrome b5 heme-binding domain-containing protein n=1 Tax=Acer negundo TaxID=4023 RepID=A0AAD5P5L5_ACENE|nr:hypothetical protein LWI28_009195 [Acer negundo]KAK4859685.1 hypothetical protein QYF36_009989 [Acer negundo]